MRQLEPLQLRGCDHVRGKPSGKWRAQSKETSPTSSTVRGMQMRYSFSNMISSTELMRTRRKLQGTSFSLGLSTVRTPQIQTMTPPPLSSAAASPPAAAPPQFSAHHVPTSKSFLHSVKQSQQSHSRMTTDYSTKSRTSPVQGAEIQESFLVALLSPSFILGVFFFFNELFF